MQCKTIVLRLHQETYHILSQSLRSSQKEMITVEANWDTMKDTQVWEQRMSWVAEAVSTMDNDRPPTEHNNSLHAERLPHQRRAETVAVEMCYCRLQNQSINKSINQSIESPDMWNSQHEARKQQVVRISRVSVSMLCNQMQLMMNDHLSTL